MLQVVEAVDGDGSLADPSIKMPVLSTSCAALGCCCLLSPVCA